MSGFVTSGSHDRDIRGILDAIPLDHSFERAQSNSREPLPTLDRVP